MKVTLGDTTLGQHGSNIYYKEFFVTSETGKRHYRPGRFYFVKKSKNFDIAIAEFQLIWHSLKDEKYYASVKLYFKPEKNSDEEEDDTFGEDEVVEASRQVVVECSEFSAWECTSDRWHTGLGKTLYSGIDLDKLKALNRDKQSISQLNKKVCYKVKILTFPQYNRYKTCMRMLLLGIPMTYFQLLARGGLDITNLNTIILFSKRQFEKDDLENFSPTLDIPVPAFKGRPRKRKNLQKPTTFTTVPAKKNKVNTEDVFVADVVSGNVQKYDEEEQNEDDDDDEDNLKLSTLAKKKNMINNIISAKEEVKESVVNSDVHRLPYQPLSSYHTSEPISIGRGIRGRDTICHEKRERAIKDKEEHERFVKELHDFMTDNGTPIVKIPSIGCASVDPLVLYNAVVGRGGYAQVTLNRLWRNVYDCLGHSTMITNAATGTRKVYEKLLLPYEKHLRNNKQHNKKTTEKQKENTVVLRFDPSDIIKPREVENRDLERKKIMAARRHEAVSIGGSHPPPPQEILQNVHHENIISAENLSISLMMSKQRGRPSKKFRNQIERLRTRQTMQLAVEEEEEHRNTFYFSTNNQHHHHHHVAGPKHGRFPPRKHWVNELNVDIASRQHPEMPMSSPVYRAKERGDHERTSSTSSDVELISPRRSMEVHSPLRQGRRIYPSTRDSHALNGFVPDAFVPILPKTMKPQHNHDQRQSQQQPQQPQKQQHQQQQHQQQQQQQQQHQQQQQQQQQQQKHQGHHSKRDMYGFKIQSVRSLAEAQDQPSRQPTHSHTSTVASKVHTSVGQYVHYPYNNAVETSYDYSPTRYYSLSDANKLVQVSTLSSSGGNNSKTNSSYKSTSQKNAFRDASFSMRTFRHEQIPADNNSYKIKSAALKNHEPYIIHHPSHLNRGYREIPGQYPVIYTHQPIMSGAGRYAMKGGGEYTQHPNVGFVYERVHPRYEKVSPRNDKIIPHGDQLPTTTTYVKYIESSPPPRPAPPLQKWTELQKVGGNV